MDQLELARLTPDAWRDYRAIRLAALADAPSAFGSTLAAERSLGEVDWRARLARRAQFVVRCRGEAVGTAGGMVEDGADLVSMWVHPAWRGRGVGDLLVRGVLDWAREQGHTEVRLWVSVGNSAAERLYARHGFVRTGDRQPITTADPARQEFAMTRAIDATPSGDGTPTASDRD
ncbi:MAG: GNAT family N-acetyltransferase [Chloroflexia bacterium]|nr:GNAT family N-acetyltransferase [Chloroflexia bacterium]